jgi:hypothetical protein
MLRSGGRTAFLTIVVSPRLTSPAHRVAARLGPRAVTTTRPLDVLMKAAGFVDVEVANLTKDFREVTVAWLDEYSRYEAELQMIMGAEFDERRSDRQDLLEGIQKRLLRRVLVTGTAP